jgi:hypothetical protein
MSPATVTTHQFAINNLIKVALSNGKARKCVKQEPTSRGRNFPMNFCNSPATLSLSNPRTCTHAHNEFRKNLRTFFLSSLSQFKTQKQQQNSFLPNSVCLCYLLRGDIRGERGKHLT